MMRECKTVMNATFVLKVAWEHWCLSKHGRHTFEVTYTTAKQEGRAIMSRRSASIVQQLVAARSAAAAAGSQQQLLAINGARFMSAGNANSKDGKVMHPDLLNENLKKTQVSQDGPHGPG